ncbi:MAG: peptidase S1 [Maricaulis sp.]|jgi:hypothetical protein|nr:peptidase S1 [Maricaulis sp.]
MPKARLTHSDDIQRPGFLMISETKHVQLTGEAMVFRDTARAGAILMGLWHSALIAVTVLAVTAGSGEAWGEGDGSGDSLYLSAGFTPDPKTIDLQLDGRIDAAIEVSETCHGFISGEEPDVSVYYNAGPFPLILSADSDEDMTLVVNAPDGQWYCDDDSGSGLNPSIRFGEPVSGNYEIWVGRYLGPGPATVRLSISELYSE